MRSLASERSYVAWISIARVLENSCFTVVPQPLSTAKMSVSKQLPAMSPEKMCPLPPRRHCSMVVLSKENMFYIYSMSISDDMSIKLLHLGGTTLESVNRLCARAADSLNPGT